MTGSPRRALLVVDVQRDFLPGGALAVPGGDEVIAPIARLARDGGFQIIVATRDWHPPDHGSFTERGGPWPAHCVRDTPGAALDPGLPAADAIVDKGTAVEGPGYSGFEGGELGELLRARNVGAVTITGLATDVCVAATARDTLAAGLHVHVARDAIRGIDAAAGERVLCELAAAGARID